MSRRTALAKRIKVQSVKDTQLFRLSVTDTSPTRAPVLADTIAEEFTALANALQEARYKDAIGIMQAKLDKAEALISDTQSRADAASCTEDRLTKRNLRGSRRSWTSTAASTNRWKMITKPCRRLYRN